MSFFIAKPPHPWASNASAVGIVASIAVMVVAGEAPGVILLVAAVLALNVCHFYEIRTQHVAASLTFGEASCVLRVGKAEREIAYRSVGRISREVYKRPALIGTQPCPNQFTVHLRGGKPIVLRVSHREEAARTAELRRLNKQIYGMGRLGVGIAGPPPDKAEQIRRDEQYEAARPRGAYSLESAIDALCERCGLALTNSTGAV